VLVALSQASGLLLLFVVLPFVVGGIVMGLVSWRSNSVAPAHRTSDLLEHGEPGRAEVLDLRTLGSFVDVRPMVAFRLSVRPGLAGEETDTFELVVTQSIPRRLAAALQPGMVLEVRLSADHTAGAIVVPAEAGH
jgi:hypothetical protein